MTFDEMIERIKIHNEIHSKSEPQSVLITEALNKAVELLERSRWYYPEKNEFPKNGEKVLIVERGNGLRWLATRHEEAVECDPKEGRYVWWIEPINEYLNDFYDYDVLAWCRLPKRPDEEDLNERQG